MPRSPGTLSIACLGFHPELPFEVKAPNGKTVAAMQEARKGGLPSFNSVSNLMADLNAED